MRVHFPDRNQVLAWGVSAVLHVVLLALLGLVAPSLRRSEAPPRPLQVQIHLPTPAAVAPPAPMPPAPTERVPQRQTPLGQPSAAPPALRPADQTAPQAPTPPPPERPAHRESAVSPTPSAPPVERAPEPAPLTTEAAAVETPTLPPKPAFDLSGLDDLQVEAAGPATSEGVTRQALRDNLGEIELEGRFSELRANPPRPLLRSFQNAYGTVVIEFTVQEGLLRIGTIEFTGGTLPSLPAAEQERLRTELRQWLRAWTLLGARTGARGRLRVQLVPQGS